MQLSEITTTDQLVLALISRGWMKSNKWEHPNGSVMLPFFSHKLNFYRLAPKFPRRQAILMFPQQTMDKGWGVAAHLDPNDNITGWEMFGVDGNHSATLVPDHIDLTPEVIDGCLQAFAENCAVEVGG